MRNLYRRVTNSAALEAKGYTVNLKMDASMVVRGYTVQSGNSVYKSSAISRDLTPSRIQETWEKMLEIPTQSDPLCPIESAPLRNQLKSIWMKRK